MKLRLAARALAEAKRIKTWWRENRPDAPDLFEQELDAALERISARPSSVGTLYEQGDLGAPVRRVLLRKTQNHVYFAVEGDEIVVVSVWGAPKERGPKL
jgi:plasmid stabilization system protein ParE